MHNRNQYVSTRRRSTYGRNQNISPFESAKKLGPISNAIMIALMITILGLIYLVQATKLTSYDYQSSKIDNQISELTSKKNNLEVEKARLMALSNVESSSVAQNMTQPTEVKYLNN